MKTRIKNLFPLTALLAGFVLMPAGQATAQTFTTLYSFTGGSDGANPNAGLILSGNTLYGTAYHGGSSDNGTVFAVNTGGTGFATLYNFTATTGGIPGTDAPSYNSDGAHPQAGLILSGNTLYGTAYRGGTGGVGTVFAVNTDGTGFTTLYSFTGGSDGLDPNAGLILSGNTVYGTAVGGGSSGWGTVFAVNTNGTGFTTLYSFTAGPAPYYTNSDGGGPEGGVILSGSTLYGTAEGGGSGDNGTVFAVNTDGTGFTTLHSFTRTSTNSSGWSTNSDGAEPYAGLILSGTTLYGTASWGGSSHYGTVFAVNTDGTGFTTLHSFSAGSGFNYNITNSDGAEPYAGLILSGNTLYGTAVNGGSAGNGTVFAVNTDGSGFTTLYSFTGVDSNNSNSDGARPLSGLILSGNTLYGTAVGGGSSGCGTVFSLTLPVAPPQLTLIHSGANVVLTWPTNAAGFTLQSTTNLLSPVAWKTNSPAPVVVNGQNTVTNLISGAQQFFRLSQ